MPLVLAVSVLLCTLAAAAESTRLPQDGIQLLQSSVGATRGADVAEADEGARQSGRTEAAPFKILLFFSLGAQPMTKRLVPRNVDHFRATSGLSGDVYLAHYDSKRDEWKKELGPWYEKNVDFSVEHSGLKFWLAKDVLLPSQQEAKKLPRVDIHNYDYLWILDEDAHFYDTNLAKMFELASRAGASIMAPSFTTLRNEDTKVHVRKRIDHYCQPTEPPCIHQAPDHQCSFRYTNFIETPFPFMRPQVFEEVIGGCKECFPNRTSTWGLDKIWCHYAAHVEHIHWEQGCAIIDATPIIHENTKAHPKYSKRGTTCGKECNFKTHDAVLKALSEYESWPPKTTSCEQ